MIDAGFDAITRHRKGPARVITAGIEEYTAL